MGISSAEARLAAELELQPLDGWDLVREYSFHPSRAWRFDFAFPSQRLAIEVEGRYHKTHAGHRNDCEKFNKTARLGWRVLRFPADQERHAADWAALIREVLCSPPPPSPSAADRKARAQARRARAASPRSAPKTTH